MSGRCLGDRIADLADGRMTPAGTERAYAHVAACPACRTALDAHRSASSALRSLEAPGPRDDLLARLAGIAAPPVEASRVVPVAAAAVPIPSQAIAAGVRPSGPAGVRPRTSTRVPRRRIVVAGAAGIAALALAAAVGATTAGAGVVTPPRPRIAPVVELFAVEHSVSVDRMPLSGPRYDTTVLATAIAAPTPAP